MLLPYFTQEGKPGTFPDKTDFMVYQPEMLGPSVANRASEGKQKKKKNVCFLTHSVFKGSAQKPMSDGDQLLKQCTLMTAMLFSSTVSLPLF